MHDAFINSVKEADFLRNGTAKGIMTLSREDSYGLWQAVQDRMYQAALFYITYMSPLLRLYSHRFNIDDFTNFQRINNILLPNPSNGFRNIPLRIFLPSPPDSPNPSLKVIQSTFPPVIPAAATSPTPAGRPSQPQTQTIGTALHSLLPSLFPSKRFPLLAKPVLHGTVVPMTAPVEEVVRSAAYPDGWLGIVVSMVG
jgi:autophagy-related protein 5